VSNNAWRRNGLNQRFPNAVWGACLLFTARRRRGKTNSGASPTSALACR